MRRIIFILTLLISFAGFSQKTNLPIFWKVGDTWKYQIDQKNIGGITGSEKQTNKVAQIKVLKIKPKPYPGFLLEWKYLGYVSFETDTLEDKCAIMFKNFLLQTPIQVQIDEKGAYQDWVNKEEVKKKFIDFYTKEGKKTGNTDCLKYANSGIQMAGRFSPYLDALIPELATFFTAFSLFPLDKNQKIDTVEVFNDYIFDNQKIITLPKSIYFNSKISERQIAVNYGAIVSEPEYKKYFSESTRLAWDKHGLKKDDNVRVDLEKTLDEFQPKNSDIMEAVFDGKTGAIISFDYKKEEWMMLKGGQSYYFKYTKI